MAGRSYEPEVVVDVRDGRVGALSREQRMCALRAQRLGDDDEAADRHDAPAQPAAVQIVEDKQD